jgi:hypothetical protein
MNWSKRFKKPIVLKDGRTIASLTQARDLIIHLPRTASRHRPWDDTVDAVYDAAHLRDGTSIELAHRYLEQSLKADGMI